MNPTLVDFAGQGEIIIVAGAGVSAIKPTALPGWSQLQEDIAQALRRRLELTTGRNDWLEGAVSKVAELLQRKVNPFSPEYQAQVVAKWGAIGCTWPPVLCCSGGRRGASRQCA